MELRNKMAFYHALTGFSPGISIVGGKVDDKIHGTTAGIFIKNVIPDSPAGQTGMLFTGDHVVAIGDTQLDSSDQSRAVQAIKDQGFTIKFTVRSLCKVFQVRKYTVTN